MSPFSALGEEPTIENLNKKLTEENSQLQQQMEQANIRIDRAIGDHNRCETNLAELWSKANRIGRDKVELEKRFKDMENDYNNIKKQLDEKLNPKHESNSFGGTSGLTEDKPKE